MAGSERPVDELLCRNPHLREGLADYDGTWMLLAGGVLNIYGNLDRHDGDRIGGNDRLVQIQFARKFEVLDSTLRHINDCVLTQHPQAHLRETFNGHGAFDNLDHLEHLPNLRSLGFLGSHAVDLMPVRSHGAIEYLGAGGLGTSLEPLNGQKHLMSFGWYDRLKHTEVIATFPDLERLGIVSQRLKDLSFLAPLQRLRSLSFSLGGTRNFSDLPGFPALEELSIWRTRKLEIEELLPINEIRGLRRLALGELPRITTFDWLTNPSIRLLELERLKGLHPYESLSGLPGLETLVLRDTFTATQIAELALLPALKTLFVHDYPLNKIRPELDPGDLPFAVKLIDFAEGEFPDSASSSS